MKALCFAILLHLLITGCVSPDGRWHRHEVLFGEVSDAEWAAFAQEVITPAFPDGFTVMETEGQWRTKEGEIVQEESRYLLVLHPDADSHRKLHAIADAFKARFDEEAVLLVHSRAEVLFR